MTLTSTSNFYLIQIDVYAIHKIFLDLISAGLVKYTKGDLKMKPYISLKQGKREDKGREMVMYVLLKIAKIIMLVSGMAIAAQCQTFTVKGKISTPTGPVRYASVTFISSSDTTRKFSALTDTSGNYQLDVVTSVKPPDNLPTKFELEQNYPNPFSSSTSISYKLAEQSNISVKIYNILGQVVKEFRVGSQVAGIHGVVWDGTNNLGKKVATGVYFYQLQTSKEVLAKKMVLTGNLPETTMYLSKNLHTELQSSIGNHLGKLALTSYKIYVTNTDSTKPEITSLELTGITITHDTTINFGAQRAPVALISGNQPVKVGQYLILDGSGSDHGDGDTLIYKWTANSNNPGYVYVDASNPSQRLGFLIKGIYKFTLIVNNGYTDSSPDTVAVIINSRDKIAFVDSCFELSLREALSMPNAEITDSMLLTLDTLVNISGYYFITVIDGIEKCTNLKLLSFSNQRITDLSLISGLTQLQELYLGGNRNIVDISPLANLTNLKELNLEQNNIYALSPLKNMTKMVDLNLINNPITDISSLKDMMDLEQLWIENPVKRTFFPLAGTSVIVKFTKLWLLWLSGFDCRDLSFVYTLDSLQYLRLSFCNVKDITPATNLIQLERLYMDSDSITDITPLANLINLNILDLQFNQITNIKPLVDNSGLGQGDAVGLNGNPLDSISVNQYIPQLRSRGVAVFY